MKVNEVLKKLIINQKNVKFDELVKLIELFGFKLKRISGSHHIYKKEGIEEMVNIQNVKGEAKPYQIKQFLSIIEKYNLELED